MTTFLTTLRTLDAAATKGPWEEGRSPIIDPETGWHPPIVYETSDGRTPDLCGEHRANLLLMEHLRNHAAAIIGCVEAARGAEEALESAIPYFEEYACGKPHKDLDAGVAALSALATALAALEGK